VAEPSPKFAVAPAIALLAADLNGAPALVAAVEASDGCPGGDAGEGPWVRVTVAGLEVAIVAGSCAV
jgi:hypothetical protein